MSIFRFIKTNMWQDPFFLDLTSQDKLFHIYLISNGKTTQCGIFEQTPSMMAFELGYSVGRVEEQIARFEQWGKLARDKTTHEFFLLSWLKHNFHPSPNVITCMEKELEKVKSPALLMLWMTLASPLQGPWDKEKEKEEEKEEGKEKEETRKDSREGTQANSPISLSIKEDKAWRNFKRN